MAFRSRAPVPEQGVCEDGRRSSSRELERYKGAPEKCWARAREEVARPFDAEPLDGDVFHAPSACRPGGGASEVGNGSDGFEGRDGGRVGGRLGQATPFAFFRKGFFQRVEGGLPRRWVPGQCASRRDRRLFAPPPGPGVPGRAFGWGHEDAASQGGAPPGVPLRPHAATFPVLASTGTKARVSQEWTMSSRLPS